MFENISGACFHLLPTCTHLVLGVYEVREGAQLLQLVFVLGGLDKRSVVFADPVERVLRKERQGHNKERCIKQPLMFYWCSKSAYVYIHSVRPIQPPICSRERKLRKNMESYSRTRMEIKSVIVRAAVENASHSRVQQPIVFLLTLLTTENAAHSRFALLVECFIFILILARPPSSLSRLEKSVTTAVAEVFDIQWRFLSVRQRRVTPPRAV